MIATILLPIASISSIAIIIAIIRYIVDNRKK